MLTRRDRVKGSGASRKNPPIALEGTPVVVHRIVNEEQALAEEIDLVGNACQRC